ncbi:hypothetical protein CSTERTH_09215 [Thermoclostridium stercorarium subsp. thermolacticum DSM 2910]|uniref:Uncharacterized protein n=2 Tax=Thermoclostridium stercorarium TaxID=1510 RepID=A0A1B1YLU8_THEST|nr:hypothetical protein [Thermoclostridium stercorarium]ANW99190.1 hypothetical protein CSTERTH_09215 [Thermoclostridium stercorarium subsp. thermolacticum DSM 2910]ANX01748.1 hypothetical protein CSTERLE_09275 [Thermoclostridium stercorarium subsp. leptospartum DSM 9219]UZQ84879.1 hypothetical protein ODU73_001951 [Thermoclostridium stercorarium]
MFFRHFCYTEYRRLKIELSDKVKAVSRIDYIIAHMDESIVLDDIAKAVGYSKYHAGKIR